MNIRSHTSPNLNTTLDNCKSQGSTALFVSKDAPQSSRIDYGVFGKAEAHATVFYSTDDTMSLPPLYWQRKGKYPNTMGVKAGKRFNFVAVVTPHMREQTRNRTGKTVQQLFEASEVVLPDIWARLDVEQCHWVKIGKYLMYVKRKYNDVRKRWELELISLTPSHHAITLERKFAKPMKSLKGDSTHNEGRAESRGSSTAFPSWFCDDESDDEEE